MTNDLLFPIPNPQSAIRNRQSLIPHQQLLGGMTCLPRRARRRQGRSLASSCCGKADRAPERGRLAPRTPHIAFSRARAEPAALHRNSFVAAACCVPVRNPDGDWPIGRA